MTSLKLQVSCAAKQSAAMMKSLKLQVQCAAKQSAVIMTSLKLQVDCAAKQSAAMMMSLKFQVHGATKQPAAKLYVNIAAEKQTVVLVTSDKVSGNDGLELADVMLGKFPFLNHIARPEVTSNSQ